MKERMDGLEVDKMLEQIAQELRVDVLRLFYKTGTGHLASSLSCIDLLATLYFKIKNDRDCVILSKGHGAAALYAVLARAGCIDRSELKTFYAYNSKLLALSSYGVNGIELPTGSLGQGVCFATGVAKANQMDENGAFVYCILGDGEMQEGSVWEAALFAANEKLNRLIYILDSNKIQASDRTENILQLEPIEDKWKSFGWNVYQTDGHDVYALETCIKEAQLSNEYPSIIIANTIKGKGISVIENKRDSHTSNPSSKDWKSICDDFGIALEELSKL